VSQIAVSATARARRLDTPAGPLALLDTGPAGTAGTALFVPGYTGSKEDFLPLLDPLARAGWRAVAMDQRGQFESPGVDDPAAYSTEALARDVLAVVADLGPPVHLVGHSFGGLVGRAAVIAAPLSFASLVLLCSGPAAIGGARQQRIEVLRPLLEQGGMAAVYAGMERLAAGDPKWREAPQELRDFLRRRFLASSPVGLQGMAEALTSEPDRVEELRATGVPVLVAHGAGDDAWSPATQARMAERLGARHAVIPDSAHSPAVENTPELLRVLLAFWGDVAAFGAARADVAGADVAGAGTAPTAAP
jgi:pimeloyl-ACP methyl ester carboxylesterase